MTGYFPVSWWMSLAVWVLLSSTSYAIPLLDGRFETTSDVQSLLKLALDAADMKEATDMTKKQSIYQFSSPREDQGGDLVTFQSLSLNARQAMADSPMYNIFRHAFREIGMGNEGESEGDFDGFPIEQYADTLVNDLFALNIAGIETEASIVLNLWMACVNELFLLMQSCKAAENDQALRALDRAAALWIGEGQEEGSNERGHLLYNMAEKAGERFDQDDGETLVNMEILDSFTSIQTQLFGNICNTDNGYRSIRSTIKATIGLMTIPLVQNLIHYAMNLDIEGANSFVELYTLATIPRVAACRPDLYNTELDLAVFRALTPDQVQPFINALQSAYRCFDITCAQVGSYLGGTVATCQDEDLISAAGYSTTRVAGREKMVLDRDVKEIDIFLEFGAYGLVLDWYAYGWNSNEYSLRDLARNEFVPDVATGSYLKAFGNYYQETVFADNWIINTLEMAPPYNNASRRQVRETVTGLLKYVVVFMNSAGALQYAISNCNSNSATALDLFDAGALLYVGSMEGEEINGREIGGEFLYATAKELCREFGTCAGTEQQGTYANVNEIVMEGLVNALVAIESGVCDEANRILENQILPTMIVPLIQGTIKYASYNAGLVTGTGDSALAIGDAFARGIIPIVAQSTSHGARKILNQMQFQLTTKPVPAGFNEVASALRGALAELSTNCESIGIFEDEPTNGNLCESSNVQASGQSNSSSSKQDPEKIAFQRYRFQSGAIADNDGDFALDIRDMRQSGDLASAQSIYSDGQNVASNGLTGMSGTRTLSALSRQATRQMIDDIMFNIYRYALYDDEDLEDTAGVDFLYADDVVVEAMNGGKDYQLAAEGAVIMNIWMVIVHQLYEALRLCRTSADPVPLIDSAVALWIGKEQAEGKFDSGWMLYSIAQTAAQQYGLEEKEAAVNTELMDRFIDLQELGKTCTGSSDVSMDMHFKVHELIRVLSKPLILKLLYHLVSDEKNLVELYSVSVIPQAFACSESIGRNLQNVLFQGYTIQTLSEDMVQDLTMFLRCQQITPEDLLHSPSVDSDLRNLLQSLVTRLEYYRDLSDFLPMAGYSPNSDVSQISRLDLDVLEINIMMRTQAYEAAKDIYKNGHNSIAKEESERFLSLHSLATSPDRTGIDAYELYSEFYASNTYADEIMGHIFEKSGPFFTATRGEAAELASRTLQVMVSYMGVLEKMKASVDTCNKGENEIAKLNWDAAVALFIGSSQGLLSGGLLSGDGGFLYSLGNEVCADFGVCEASGESMINEKLIFLFAEGRDAVSEGQCDHLERLQNWELLPRISIPVIQGLMHFAIENTSTATRDPESLATAHVMAKAMIPLVDKVNATSSSVLRQTFGNFRTMSVGQSMDSVFEAFAYALRGMGIDCEDVGVPIQFPELALCVGGHAGSRGNVPDQVPVASTPTDLGEGLYITTTYVDDRASIAKDVADIEEALGSNSYEMAKLIYRDGKNSEVYDGNGKFMKLRSLKSFSTAENAKMVDEPIFNFYMYTLQGSDGTFLSKDVQHYADSIVEDAFNQVYDRDLKMLPVEAVVAFNVWMHIVHNLYTTLKRCKSKLVRDDYGIHAIDIAVAYWIGDGQIAGSGEKGHLLYALAERMGDEFNLNVGGQSRTNTNIMRLFNEAKHELALPGACTDSPSSYLHLSRIVNDIISVMAVPLIQSLIHSLRMGDRARVSLYAHAVIPLTAGCNSESFEYLKEKLLIVDYNAIEVDSIIARIQDIYPCLGLTCSDIGVHRTETEGEIGSCEDPDVFTALAGYKPASDVREFARLDLDLRQMDILLQMKAYEAAENLYTYGKHIKGPNGGSMSLFHLATTTERRVVPEYDAFMRYYGTLYDDPSTYADQVVRSALSGANNWNDDQRRAIVLKASQVMIMFFAGLQALYEAVADCQTTASFRAAGSSESWDRGAAILIGSLEGSQTNGTQQGYLYYDLAQEHCEEFGTCLDGSIAAVDVNNQLVSLLYTGRGAVLGGSCSALQKAANEISSLLLVPAIQGALLSATTLSDTTISDFEAGVARAEGFVYSRAVLPLVGEVDRNAAENIDTLLGFPGPSSNVRSTASIVFASFARVYPRLNVDCEMVGNINGNDACTGVVYQQPGAIIAWVLFGVGFVICILSFYIILRYKRKEGPPRFWGGLNVAKKGWLVHRRNLPENNPRFLVPDNGELNHSMDLLEKAFSSHSRQTDITTAILSEDMVYEATALTLPSIAMTNKPSIGSDGFEEEVPLTSNAGNQRPSSDII